MKRNNNKNELNKKIYSTEIINDLIADISKGYEVDTSPFFEKDVELRAPNIVFKLTPEEYEEFKKCAFNAEYFIEKYCKFLTDNGRITVKLRDYQKKIIKAVTSEHYDKNLDMHIPDNKGICILASRQVGKTTTTAAYMAHYLCFHTDRNISILANKMKTATEIVTKINDIFKGLPYFLKPCFLNF